MLSKAKIKLINSLSHKKYRDESGLFVAEGVKTVRELLQYFPCEMLFATKEVTEIRDVTEVTDDELRKISFLKTPQGVLAVFRKCDMRYEICDSRTSHIAHRTSHIAHRNTLSLALDCIQDPGNLGTILRIADWFGIKDIFCSADCADVFNPKTVQATMGALGRVRVHYADLAELIRNTDLPVFGTFLGGENIYRKQLPAHGLIVMGSEGNGISPEVEKLIGNRLFIPPYPIGAETSESLNVAVATAIVCAEFRRGI
ncbi:MAG: RNA methyltransferase [Prevotellaceae bacterium]|jgi:TrmH family RNA methyltransferase|nr:RNA methyltransferase [Prevotellaceae bacterium]